MPDILCLLEALELGLSDSSAVLNESADWDSVISPDAMRDQLDGGELSSRITTVALKGLPLLVRRLWGSLDRLGYNTRSPEGTLRRAGLDLGDKRCDLHDGDRLRDCKGNSEEKESEEGESE